MGKSFIPTVASSHHVSHMSMHLGAPIALADQAPISSLHVSNSKKTIAQMRGELFRSEEISDRMKVGVKGFHVKINVPQAQTMPTDVQYWEELTYGVGCLCFGVGSVFLLSIIYNVFFKGNHRAPLICMKPLDGAELQSSAASALPVVCSSGGVRTVGITMSEGKSCDEEAMHDATEQMQAIFSTEGSTSPNVAAQDLLEFARASPVYLTTPIDISKLRGLVAQVEATAQPPSCEAVCTEARWKLLATTRTQGSELLQLMTANSSLGEFCIEQRVSRKTDCLRVDNVVTISRPASAGWASAWTLLAPGGQSSLVLEHNATVIPSPAGPRVSLELKKAVLDGARRGSDVVEEIVGVPLPKQPEALSAVLAEAGTFDVVFEDAVMRVTRGVGGVNEEPVLRVFSCQE